MDDELIRNWNNTVTPQDVVVHLGDFTLEVKVIANQYKERLNGNIIFVKGNHDHWITKEKRYEYHKKVGSVHVIGTHYPLRTWPRSFSNGFNLHGHCHNMLTPHWYNQLDCGVDSAIELVGEYRPLSYGEVCTAVERNNREWVQLNPKLWDTVKLNGRHERGAELIGAVK
jgi:calcineurin-like phosphoesterase family protein